MSAVSDLRSAIAKIRAKGLLVTGIYASTGFYLCIHGTNDLFDGIPVSVDEQLREEVGFYLDCAWANQKPEEPTKPAAKFCQHRGARLRQEDEWYDTHLKEEDQWWVH